MCGKLMLCVEKSVENVENFIARKRKGGLLISGKVCGKCGKVRRLPKNKRNFGKC